MRHSKYSLFALLTALLFICLPPVLAQGRKSTNAPRRANSTTPVKIEPIIPKANRNQPDKVFLEHADVLELQENNREYQIVRGNVQFRKGGMFMFCDSARFYEATNSLDAFSNVRMQQGDTLFVYADELNYDGISDMARLYALQGRKVRMINRDVKLETDVFEYDLGSEVGYYQFGGVLTDRNNKLTSREGYYYPRTKNAEFFWDVVLTGPRRNDTIKIFTDSLRYNTRTGQATLLCSTLIANRDGEIRTNSGMYNTRNQKADLFGRSMVVTKRGNTLTGDTLVYDKRKGIAEAFGNMIMTDSARNCTLIGDYGYYDEVRDSAFVTGRALAMEYSQRDTLYTHADTLVATQMPDSTYRTRSFHNVRFYRADLQGICDSLVTTQNDSMLRLFRHPVVWSGKRQVFGNRIDVHFNDSTADRIDLPEFGMLIEHIGEDCYDQLSGSKMTAWITDTVLNRLYVEGNVHALMFPMEKDSVYNKFTQVEASYLNAYFKDNKPEKIIMWPEVTGTVTPLYLAKKSALFLSDYQWYEDLKPMSPDDVFVVPEKMRLLMEQPPVGGRRR